VALEVLVGDSRIRMDRKEHRVIRESRDDGGVSRGMIRGEEEVEKRAKDTALGHQISPHGRWSTWYYTGPGSSGLEDMSVKADSTGLEVRPSVYISRPGCHTLSNAWATSRKTAVRSVRSSRLFTISWTTRCACWMWEWPGRNPNF